MNRIQRSVAVVLSATALSSQVAGFAQAGPAGVVPDATLSGVQARASVPGAAQLAARTHLYQDGSYTGPVFDAYYGLVQVQANVQGGRLVSIDVLQYPSDRRTSRSINRQALPMLQAEVISAQTTRVNIISGATLTSNAYLQSLSSALDQANS